MDIGMLDWVFSKKTSQSGQRSRNTCSSHLHLSHQLAKHLVNNRTDVKHEHNRPITKINDANNPLHTHKRTPKRLNDDVLLTNELIHRDPQPILHKPDNDHVKLTLLLQLQAGHVEKLRETDERQGLPTQSDHLTHLDHPNLFQTNDKDLEH